MDRLIELGQLMDWYGTFLTRRQATLVGQYVYEDCSLAEIAEREGVSRQAVRDAIARSESELASMERRLRLIERTARTRAKVDELSAMTDDAGIRDKLSELIAIWEGDDGV